MILRPPPMAACGTPPSIKPHSVGWTLKLVRPAISRSTQAVRGQDLHNHIKANIEVSQIIANHVI